MTRRQSLRRAVLLALTAATLLAAAVPARAAQSARPESAAIALELRPDRDYQFAPLGDDLLAWTSADDRGYTGHVTLLDGATGGQLAHLVVAGAKINDLRARDADRFEVYTDEAVLCYTRGVAEPVRIPVLPEMKNGVGASDFDYHRESNRFLYAEAGGVTLCDADGANRRRLLRNGDLPSLLRFDWLARPEVPQDALPRYIKPRLLHNGGAAASAILSPHGMNGLVGVTALPLDSPTPVSIAVDDDSADVLSNISYPNDNTVCMNWSRNRRTLLSLPSWARSDNPAISNADPDIGYRYADFWDAGAPLLRAWQAGETTAFAVAPMERPAEGRTLLAGRPFRAALFTDRALVVSLAEGRNTFWYLVWHSA